ncbi:MAG: hypothetical protein Q7S00_01240, partial [bacterium]|nr:hypothetical protein [bacterium]
IEKVVVSLTEKDADPVTLSFILDKGKASERKLEIILATADPYTFSIPRDWIDAQTADSSHTLTIDGAKESKLISFKVLPKVEEKTEEPAVKILPFRFDIDKKKGKNHEKWVEGYLQFNPWSRRYSVNGKPGNNKDIEFNFQTNEDGPVQIRVTSPSGNVIKDERFDAVKAGDRRQNYNTFRIMDRAKLVDPTTEIGAYQVEVIPVGENSESAKTIFTIF